MKNANYRAGSRFHAPKYWRMRISAFEAALILAFTAFVLYLLLF
ncbi:MAG: hypothetical protein ACOYJD_05000 [Christensenellales bacterium]|jgi:hypothetical protein